MSVVLDTVGKKCPFPMMELQRYMAENRQVQSLTLLASDPNAVDDIYALDDLGELRVKQVRQAEGRYWIDVERGTT